MISRLELKRNVLAIKDETKAALQTVYDSLNKGQQKKVLSVPEVRALFERYNVELGE